MKKRASASGGCWKLHASVSTSREALMTAAYDGSQVVGMELHRRRSALVRMTADGRKLETARITNSPAELRRVSPGSPPFSQYLVLSRARHFASSPKQDQRGLHF
jgi:hypothetical protein